MTQRCLATTAAFRKTYACHLERGHPGLHQRTLGTIRLTWISEGTRTSTAIISRVPSGEALRR